MKKLVVFIPVFLILVMATITCQKPERDNPWDEKATLNPNEWAPQNLTIETVSITKKRLTWTFEMNNIEALYVDRKKGDEPWQKAYAILSKETRSWNDDKIIPDPELTFQYRLYAVAGKNNSEMKIVSEKATFPAPKDLLIMQNSIISIKLSWQYNNLGQEGFIIERKQGNGNWEQLAITTVSNFTDSDFELNNTIHYRVKAFYGQHHTEYVENYFNSEIPAPYDLKITKNSMSSLKLSWNYSFIDIQGFVIYKKVNEGQWLNWISFLDANQNSFVDNEVDLNNSDYTYRILAYYKEFKSTISEIRIQVPKMGQLYAGGIVFYLNNNGGGLVCTEIDQSTNAIWGCSGSTIGGTGSGIDTGSANTTVIVTGCTTSGIAARLCNELVINGYSDWFLPSLFETGEMLNNLGPIGIGGFANDYYWSSTEYSSDFAWKWMYNSGISVYTKIEKNQPAHVRAVRAF